MRGWLMVGLGLALAGAAACGSGTGPSGAGTAGSGAGAGGRGGGGGDGGQGGTCPASQVTDLPSGINLNNECPYVGANTAGCGAGTFEYNCPDPLGFGIPPVAGCVHPTSGADAMQRWCCVEALCSHFPSRDARCDCQSANRYDYNCAPAAPAAATCVANASGDFCCPFN